MSVEDWKKKTSKWLSEGLEDSDLFTPGAMEVEETDSDIMLSHRDIHYDIRVEYEEDFLKLVVETPIETATLSNDERLSIYRKMLIANDELTLPSADGEQGIDDLVAGIDRFVNEVAGGDRGREPFQWAVLVGMWIFPAVQRPAQRIDDPAEKGITDGQAECPAGQMGACTCGQFLGFTQQDTANEVRIKVQDQGAAAVPELQNIVNCCRG